MPTSFLSFFLLSLCQLDLDKLDLDTSKSEFKTLLLYSERVRYDDEVEEGVSRKKSFYNDVKN